MRETLDEILSLAQHELAFLSEALEAHTPSLMNTPSGVEAVNVVALARFVVARTREELKSGAEPPTDHSTLHAALERMRKQDP